MNVGNFAPEANTIDWHRNNAKNTNDSCNVVHGGGFRCEPKGPQRQKQAEQCAHCDEDDVKPLD